MKSVIIVNYIFDVVFCVFIQDLDLPDILVETEKRGMSFDQLLTIPEQDDWLYKDGKSTSCIAFILEMYKEAGLFDPIASSIQVTEFTVSLSRTIHLFGYTLTYSIITVFKHSIDAIYTIIGCLSYSIGTFDIFKLNLDLIIVKLVVVIG